MAIDLETSAAYRQLLDGIAWSQAHGYGVFHLTDDQIALGRLFAYAFRTQTVGTFRAARMLLDRVPAPTPPLTRAIDLLRGLEELSLVPVPTDFRVVVGTVAAYDRGMRQALAALDDHLAGGGDGAIGTIRDRLVANLNRVTNGNGIWTASDLATPEQGVFKVPGITVIIVPLVYGDFHSWNTALCVAGSIGQTTHRHQQGVEIHLGYSPLHGRTLLGDAATTLREGYAMPIPPLVDHGYDNLSDEDHLLPLVFGSLRLGGWGIFADVEPRLRPFDDFAETPLDAPSMNGSVYIDRAIDETANWPMTRRDVLIPGAHTATPITGGLELGVSRIGAGGKDLSSDTYRILSVRRGRGRLRLGPMATTLVPHDHVGIPAGMVTWLEPLDGDPLVVLDATIEPASVG